MRMMMGMITLKTVNRLLSDLRILFAGRGEIEEKPACRAVSLRHLHYAEAFRRRSSPYAP